MTDSSTPPQEIVERTLAIDGMGCEHCVSAVREAIEAIESAEAVTVEIGRATVRFDPGATNHVEIAAAIADAGFTVTS